MIVWSWQWFFGVSYMCMYIPKIYILTRAHNIMFGAISLDLIDCLFYYCVCFVCLFGFFRPTWELFTHLETFLLPVKGCTFWPMLSAHGSEGSLACHTYCNTRRPFMTVISEDPWHSYLMPMLGSGALTTFFSRISSFANGIRTPNLPLANAQTNWATAAAK